jgi:hypothetical protein
MSKLLDQLFAKPTGVRRPVERCLSVDIAEEVPPVTAFETAKEYSFTLSYKTLRVVQPEVPLQAILEQERRQLAELIYGEFRSELLKLDREVYDMDWRSAQHTITRILGMCRA